MAMGVKSLGFVLVLEEFADKVGHSWEFLILGRENKMQEGLGVDDISGFVVIVYICELSNFSNAVKFLI